MTDCFVAWDQFVNTRLHTHSNCSDIIHDLLHFIMNYMLIVEDNERRHLRASSQQVFRELDALYKRLQDPSYVLVGKPDASMGTKTPNPEGVQIILSEVNRKFVGTPEGYSQLRVHTGVFSRLLPSGSRHSRRPSGTGYFSPQRSETDPAASGSR